MLSICCILFIMFPFALLLLWFFTSISKLHLSLQTPPVDEVVAVAFKAGYLSGPYPGLYSHGGRPWEDMNIVLEGLQHLWLHKLLAWAWTCVAISTWDETFPPGRNMNAHETQEVNKHHMSGKAGPYKTQEGPSPKDTETVNNCRVEERRLICL